jgi:hypothetical protein
MKTTAGVVAAVAGAVTGMWGIYEKVKSDAREYTTASYETLAPQVNQLTEALRKIEQENQQLKQAVLARSTRPTRAVTVKATTQARPSRPATATTPAAGAPAAEEPANPVAGATAEEKEQGALDKIMGTMHQTREAVDAVRKVPESFKQVLDQKKK